MIFTDTNVLSETVRPRPNTQVLKWLEKHDPELAMSTVVLAELSFGIEKIRADERAKRLSGFFQETRARFSGRIYGFDESSALIYGKIMGEAVREGRTLPAADGMIAAIALRHDAALATRNKRNFGIRVLRVIDPWEAK